MRRLRLTNTVRGLALFAVIGACGLAQSPASVAAAAAESAPGVASSQEAWRQEFDEICAKTDDSASLTAGELKNLIARSDKLKARIEASDETVRKVYLRRLQMCRELYQYLLDLKGKE